jgi:hypothetical protein
MRDYVWRKRCAVATCGAALLNRREPLVIRALRLKSSAQTVDFVQCQLPKFMTGIGSMHLCHPPR